MSVCMRACMRAGVHACGRAHVRTYVWSMHLGPLVHLVSELVDVQLVVDLEPQDLLDVGDLFPLRSKRAEWMC